jgi:hypothetical protein
MRMHEPDHGDFVVLGAQRRSEQKKSQESFHGSMGKNSRSRLQGHLLWAEKYFELRTRSSITNGRVENLVGGYQP